MSFSHYLKMLAGCVLPFLLIFLLPLIGVQESVTLLLAIILMFACHLFMMRGHAMGNSDEHDSHGDRKS